MPANARETEDKPLLYSTSIILVCLAFFILAVFFTLRISGALSLERQALRHWVSGDGQVELLDPASSTLMKRSSLDSISQVELDPAFCRPHIGDLHITRPLLEAAGLSLKGRPACQVRFFYTDKKDRVAFFFKGWVILSADRREVERVVGQRWQVEAKNQFPSTTVR